MPENFSKNLMSNMMSKSQKVHYLVGFLSQFFKLLISGSRVRVPEGVPKQADRLVFFYTKGTCIDFVNAQHNMLPNPRHTRLTRLASNNRYYGSLWLSYESLRVYQNKPIGLFFFTPKGLALTLSMRNIICCRTLDTPG